jgi:HSP20 family protein
MSSEMKKMLRDPFWDLKNTSTILEDMDWEFPELGNMVTRVLRTVSEIVPSDATSSNRRYYYGYQVTVGPDGKPHIREFGNVRPSAKGVVEQAGMRAPLVDTALDEKQNTWRFTAEMPGLNKEDIKLNISDGSVTVHAEKGDKKYHTDIPVDAALDGASAKATYTNGVLELKIKIKHAPKTKAKEVQVE